MSELGYVCLALGLVVLAVGLFWWASEPPATEIEDEEYDETR